jgi:predicted N-formylglutamate amidohydrolase
VPDTFLFTCEHGGNRIPGAYRQLFEEQQTLLNSHRGYDPGALVMARALMKAFNGTLVVSTASRLLIDLNRSISHPKLFSALTRALPLTSRNEIISQFYTPYRARVERFVSRSVSKGQRVIHISSHSFTPELNGKVRLADVGLLYDPSRQSEEKLCAHWKASLGVLTPELCVRRNYPYAGKNDGLTAYLRMHFPREAYLGIELEINQNMVFSNSKRWTVLRNLLIKSLRMACSQIGAIPFSPPNSTTRIVLDIDDPGSCAA